MSNYRNIDVDQLARGFKALSHPNRLKIFLQLVSCCVPGTNCAADEVQECCIGDLGAALDIAPSTLSHHIKELHQAGLLQMARRGQRMDCRVDTDTLATLREFFEATS
ncbi:MAG: metalloregulator ArsR/SmtB family transcription factor [Proteobacteria bacterium]|jgi:ArsR family transcriptional regulator, arsenate/arsenite/antimonite-responsive transcriptional repressor|nr:metalloregulator ArsR/SmtB family transcription factor [Pseudomonadota bacterium]MCG6936008.1 metalloregulator ArsR/SmtB family transcription factor [Pseudomonadota bacterium]